MLQEENRYFPPPTPDHQMVTPVDSPIPSPGKRVQPPREWLIDAAVFTAVLAIGIFSAWMIRNDSIRGFDEGILLVYPERILHGAIPNLDFFSVYPPGNFWAIALSYKVFGISLGSERLVGTLYRLLLIAGVFFLAHPRGRGVAVACALLTIVTSMFCGLAAFAWTGAVAFSLASIALLAFYIRKPYSKNLFLPALAGLLAGITPCLRVDTPAVGVIVAVVPLLVALPGRRPRVAFACGWLCGMLPLALHVLRIGPAQFIDNVFIETTRRIGPARHLPLPPSDPVIAQLLYLTIGCAILMAFAAGYRLWRQRRREDLVYASASLFLLCALPQALQRADVDHCMFVAQLTWTFAPIAFSLLFERFSSADPRRFMCQAVSISLPLNILLFFGHFAFPDPTKMLSPAMPDPGSRNDLEPALNQISRPVSYLSNRGRNIPAPSATEAAVLSAVIAHVESVSKEGEGLFIGTADLRFTGLNDVYLYFLLPQLIPTGYYLELNPKSANRDDSPMARDISRANVLVLSAVHSAPGPNQGDLGSDRPNQIVRAEFELSASGSFMAVYVRKRR